MIHLRIKPDSRISNDKVEQLVQTLCMYQSPLERWIGRGFDRMSAVSFETVIKRNQTNFVLTIPDVIETVARKSLESAFPQSAIEIIEEPFTKQPSLTSTLSLNYHYMFAIKVDRRGTSHLASLLDVLSIMEETDEVYLQTVAIPAPNDWYQSATEAYQRFKQGEMPTRYRLDKRNIARTGLKGAAHLVLGTIGVVTELLTGEEPEKINLDEGERALILRDGSLSSATLQKVRGDAYDTTIRIGVVCSDEKRARAIMRAATMSFRELDGDNYFTTDYTNPQRTFKRILRRLGDVKIQSEYLSIPEVSRLFLMPSGAIQERYKIPNIRQLENEIPDRLHAGGIRIGTHDYKGVKKDVYQPVHNHNELCLPHIVIGGMGQGKTKGFGANWAVQAVHNGFGALVIDPAKGEMGDEIQSVLSPDKVTRIKLGRNPISLDWCEVKYSSKARNRLANTLISFFNTATDEAGPQTARYLRAAVMAMQTSKLSEILRIFEDGEYRESCIEKMKDGIHKSTLIDYGNMSEGKQAQVLSPIYNRFDTILGDEYLSECMESDESIDMVALMSERKAVIIDVPKSELGPEGVDLIVNLLSTKIDLAMTLREESKQFPFFVIFDEPHQFLRSAKTWQAAAVESRKWRVGYVWMFHSWEQIPRQLGEIIKSAGPYYHLYPSSKRTFTDLKEEIAPFTVEDALKMPSHHAINILRSGGEVITPFIAQMSKPPSMQ